MAHQVFLSIEYRGVAQLVEQRSPKPRAGGSSPSTPAKTKILSIIVGRIFVLYDSFFIIQYSSFIKMDFRNE